VITSTALTDKPVTAPAVAIAPAGPWAHAQEDSIIEISRAVETVGRAGVWRIVVIAISAHRRNADADHDLSGA
jgi:hypothetical protein